MDASAAPATPYVIGQSETYQKIVNGAMGLFVFCGMITLIEPSPYDLAFFAALGLWFMGGVRISGFLIGATILWALREAANFIALTPYWSSEDSVIFQIISFYLFVTLVFYMLFIAERTHARVRACLNGYAIASVVCSFIAVLSFLNLFGFEKLTTIEGRVAGTFKDPNVFGSYLTLGAAYLLQIVLLRRGFLQIIAIPALAMVLVGVFLSFSRGSWGATTVACGMVVVSTFLSYKEGGTRKRIIAMGVIILAIVAGALLVILSTDSVRDFFLQRFTLAQDYDSGETGRFGNQLRSIPMLLDRPLGFGPLRYRLVFDLDPHNSYIGAFANGGWMGGFLWIILIVMTFFIGFRLIIQPSPYRVYAQVVFPATMVLLLQGFQIDIDHWRQFTFLVGLTWGLEGARRRWADAQARRLVLQR